MHQEGTRQVTKWDSDKIFQAIKSNTRTPT